jgi:hypothetical protein
MRLPRIPKEACQQTITYQMRNGDEDDWGQPSTAEIVINRCVVQLTTIYSGSNNDRQVIGNGSVYLIAGITSPLPSLTKDNLGDQIEYNGKNYAIKQIDEHLEPFSNRLYAYKLEIL